MTVAGLRLDEFLAQKGKFAPAANEGSEAPLGFDFDARAQSPGREHFIQPRRRARSFQECLPQRLDNEVIFDSFPHFTGNDHLARLCQAQDSRCLIHGIAREWNPVFAPGRDRKAGVQSDAHSEIKSVTGSKFRLSGFQPFHYFQCGQSSPSGMVLHRHRGAKRSQGAITENLDESSFVSLNCWTNPVQARAHERLQGLRVNTARRGNTHGQHCQQFAFGLARLRSASGGRRALLLAAHWNAACVRANAAQRRAHRFGRMIALVGRAFAGLENDFIEASELF